MHLNQLLQYTTHTFLIHMKNFTHAKYIDSEIYAPTGSCCLYDSF